MVRQSAHEMGGARASASKVEADMDLSEDLKPARSARKGLIGKLSGMFSQTRAAPSAPPGMRIYAVGDVHGCKKQLDLLFDQILLDRASSNLNAKLVFLGDYIDRGPDSKGTIERLLAAPEGFDMVCLRGNHDQTLLDFLEDPMIYRSWRSFGAQETLMSYGVIPPRFDEAKDFQTARDQLAEAMPASHIGFLKNLRNSVVFGDYFFVHAGARPGIALENQTPEDTLWIRDEFLGSRYDFGKIVVHGHTPVARPVRGENRISLDTGVYATGQLSAAILEGEMCRFLST